MVAIGVVVIVPEFSGFGEFRRMELGYLTNNPPVMQLREVPGGLSRGIITGTEHVPSAGGRSADEKALTTRSPGLFLVKRMGDSPRRWRERRIDCGTAFRYAELPVKSFRT